MEQVFTRYIWIFTCKLIWSVLIGQKCYTIDTLLGQIAFFSISKNLHSTFYLYSDVTKMPVAFFLTTRPKQHNSSFI